MNNEQQRTFLGNFMKMISTQFHLDRDAKPAVISQANKYAGSFISRDEPEYYRLYFLL